MCLILGLPRNRVKFTAGLEKREEKRYDKGRKQIKNKFMDQLSGLFGKLLLYLGPIFVVALIIKYLLPELIKAFKIRNKFKAGQKWGSEKNLIYWLRGMKPWEFEEYIAGLFSRLGYKTEKVGGGYDRGIDVIAEKDGVKHYIQYKKYITSEVGVGEVRDFYGAIADHLAQGKGYFITTNKFTLEAEKFAQDKPIELIDSYKLLKYIKLADEKK